MSMEKMTSLDVLRERKYRYISSVLSMPYMEGINGTGYSSASSFVFLKFYSNI